MPLDVERAYRDHAASVLSAVARTVHAPHATIEEACAETWLTAHRNRERLSDDPPERLRRWLCVVATHEAYRLMGVGRHGVNTHQPMRGDDAASADWAHPAREEADAVLDRMQARDALAQLSPRQRQAVTLWACGFTHEAIADLLGVTRAGAGRLIRRGMAKLRGEDRPR